MLLGEHESLLINFATPRGTRPSKMSSQEGVVLSAKDVERWPRVKRIKYFQRINGDLNLPPLGAAELTCTLRNPARMII